MKKLPVTLTKKESFIGWCYLVFQHLVLPVLMLLALSLLPVTFSVEETNFVVFAIDFIATTIIFSRLLLQCGAISLRMPGRTIVSALQGFGYYWLGSYAVLFLISLIYPDFYNVNDASISQMVNANYSLMFVATVFLAPMTEELIYRGLIFGSLYNKNKFLAYAVSTLAFSALHIIGYIGVYDPLHLLLCLLQYIPAALSLGFAYAKAGSIWAPILIHIIINLISMLAMR